MKFGGTSVGTAERIAQVAELVNDGQRNIVVLSAMSGDTNTLIKVSECFRNNELPQAFALITELYRKYTETIRALIPDQMTATMALSEIDNHLAELPDLDHNEIVAKGEIISTTLMYYFLMSKGIASTLLPALTFMRTLADGAPDINFADERLSRLLERTSANVVITQGFICRDADGNVANLQRGGSDYTATIIGSAIHADEVQIWTDIDGLHNNDPRFVSGTAPVRHLSHAQASALAFFGAKILHPLCISPAAGAGVTVKLLNTFEPDAPGTVIDSCPATGLTVAVAAREGKLSRTDGKAVITFSDSSDSFEMPECEAADCDVAAICVVGETSPAKVSETLLGAGINVLAATETPTGAVAAVGVNDKVAALQAFQG